MAPADGPGLRSGWFAAPQTRVCSGAPRASGRRRTPVHSGSPIPWVADRRDEALLSAPRRTVPTFRRTRPDRGGERDARFAQVASRERRRSVSREGGEGRTRKQFVTQLRLRAAMYASGVATVHQSSVSQLRLSVIQAKELIDDGLARCAKASLTLAKSMKSWAAWQRRTLSEKRTD
jgi:hypothetical protein